MLKSRSETLLRGTASLTLIEKSDHSQGLVSSNLRGETCGRNFLSVNRIERQQGLAAARWLVPAKRKAGGRCCTSPGQGLQCTRRRTSCGGDTAEVCCGKEEGGVICRLLWHRAQGGSQRSYQAVSPRQRKESPFSRHTSLDHRTYGHQVLRD